MDLIIQGTIILHLLEGCLCQLCYMGEIYASIKQLMAQSKDTHPSNHVCTSVYYTPNVAKGIASAVPFSFSFQDFWLI